VFRDESLPWLMRFVSIVFSYPVEKTEAKGKTQRDRQQESSESPVSSQSNKKLKRNTHGIALYLNKG